MSEEKMVMLFKKVLHNKFVYSGARAVYRRLPRAWAVAAYKGYRYPTEKRRPYFERAFEHVSTANLEGDYLEFGVFKGRSLVLAYQVANQCQLAGMRFFGFDSYQGLPDSEGQVFKEGEWKSSLGNCMRNLRRAKVDMQRLVLVEGLFSDSLNKAVKDLHNLRRAAVVLVDCDLYTSTKDVLAFLEDLIQPGTVIIFDDWHDFDKTESPKEFGEQRAFFEWPLHTKFKELYDDVPGRALIMEG